MVRGCRTLDYKQLFSKQVIVLVAIELTVTGRDGPILAEWSAPDCQIQDLHQNKPAKNISRNDLDGQILFQTHPMLNQNPGNQ